MNNAIILLSGGLDSVVSLAIEKNNYDNIIALTFDYGQKSAQKEINSAQTIAEHYNVKQETIKLDWLAKISTSSLNTNINIPNIKTEELDNKKITIKSAKSVWVPNRNGLFVNIAACYAEAIGYQHIIIGANKEEGETFKDNSLEFINSINTSLQNSTLNKIKLTAPLIDKTKEDIVKIGIEKNIPFELIYSCYNSTEKHCGNCESCNRLKRALELNNKHDIIEKIFQGNL